MRRGVCFIVMKIMSQCKPHLKSFFKTKYLIYFNFGWQYDWNMSWQILRDFLYNNLTALPAALHLMGQHPRAYYELSQASPVKPDHTGWVQAVPDKDIVL